MMIDTSLGISVSTDMLANYFDRLIDKVFKILPILENKELTINLYLENFESELVGLNSLLPVLNNDPLFVSMLAKSEWLIENAGKQDVGFKKVRREVFNTISICKSLKERYLALPLACDPEVTNNE